MVCDVPLANLRRATPLETVKIVRTDPPQFIPLLGRRLAMIADVWMDSNECPVKLPPVTNSILPASSAEKIFTGHTATLPLTITTPTANPALQT
jgi:hypothetical protein